MTLNFPRNLQDPIHGEAPGVFEKDCRNFNFFREIILPRVRGKAKVFPLIDEEMVVMGSDGVPPGVEGG
jgi:hypothetical protein